MSQAENFLKEISLDLLEKLRDSYKVEWPKYVIAFSFIDNMIIRYKNHPEHREIIKIYSISGIVDEDATFIGVMVREIENIEREIL